MFELTAEEKTAVAVFEMLMSASFEDWYETEFRDFAEGADNAVTKVEILNFLKRKLKSA